ncbi:hypothetical protein TNIN_283271 [Trichonephila inaurata madagascariensis]|uniref:Uncharacterized protein n=1 Tax=Trichonephila inaurata madagascariensis TaxID=2747483 RepID=A0A8X6XQ02_9ARAC|nr:hypothetical protein TNIN_283271 [Trichonephila inaurata madagascariensis]
MLLAISSRVSREGHHAPQCLHLATLDSSQRSPARGLTRRGGWIHQTEQRPSSQTLAYPEPFLIAISNKNRSRIFLRTAFVVPLPGIVLQG